MLLNSSLFVLHSSFFTLRSSLFVLRPYTIRRFDGCVIRPLTVFMRYIFFFFRVPLASLGFPPR